MFFNLLYLNRFPVLSHSEGEESLLGMETALLQNLHA